MFYNSSMCFIIVAVYQPPTIEYSCLSVCVCVCVCVSVYTISQKIMAQIHLKLEHIVVYENSLDKLDIGHCPIKVKVTV